MQSSCQQLLLDYSVDFQSPVVENLDSAIQWINLYPVNNAISFCNTYPLDTDLSVDSTIQLLNGNCHYDDIE